MGALCFLATVVTFVSAAFAASVPHELIEIFLQGGNCLALTIGSRPHSTRLTATSCDDESAIQALFRHVGESGLLVTQDNLCLTAHRTESSGACSPVTLSPCTMTSLRQSWRVDTAGDRIVSLAAASSRVQADGTDNPGLSSHTRTLGCLAYQRSRNRVVLAPCDTLEGDAPTTTTYASSGNSWSGRRRDLATGSTLSTHNEHALDPWLVYSPYLTIRLGTAPRCDNELEDGMSASGPDIHRLIWDDGEEVDATDRDADEYREYEGRTGGPMAEDTDYPPSYLEVIPLEEPLEDFLTSDEEEEEGEFDLRAFLFGSTRRENGVDADSVEFDSEEWAYPPESITLIPVEMPTASVDGVGGEFVPHHMRPLMR